MAKSDDPNGNPTATEEYSHEEINRFYASLLDLDKQWSDYFEGGMHEGYFDEGHRSFGDAVENMQRQLAMRGDIDAGDRVLDAGCCVGDPAAWLAQETGADVVGIDIDDERLDVARQVAEENGVADHTEFRHDDFTEMETLEDESFDYVWALESVCYAADKRAFIEQAHRVLKPGGRLLLADGFVSKQSLEEEDAALLRKINELWRTPNMAGCDEFDTWLHEVGFRDVEYEDITDYVMPMPDWVAYVSGLVLPIGGVLNRLGVINRDQRDLYVGYHYYLQVNRYDLVSYGFFTATA